MNSIEISKLPKKEILDGFSAQLIHTENCTISYVTIESGAVLPEHSHFHEQITQVTEGELEMTVNGTTTVLKPGMVAIIPSNYKHSGKALTICKVTDIFYPIREDYV